MQPNQGKPTGPWSPVSLSGCPLPASAPGPGEGGLAQGLLPQGMRRLSGRGNHWHQYGEFIMLRSWPLAEAIR